jgi:hypothetical protein
VVDCDSSQALVIEEACQGRNLVIQGPPGTGKSQTITNLIAAAVRAGKTVLFVAEKMAALEVVKRRLDKVGLGDVCLELHSNRISKKAALEEIERTLQLGRPRSPRHLAETVSRLTAVRDELNSRADQLHTPLEPGNLSPYEILSELIELRASQTPLPDFKLTRVNRWTPDDFQRNLAAVAKYARLLETIGLPSSHPWRGSQLEEILPLDLERLLAEIPASLVSLDQLQKSGILLAESTGDPIPDSLEGIWQSLRTARLVSDSPPVDAETLSNPVWRDHRTAIRNVADAARAILRAQEKLAGVVMDVAWDIDVAPSRRAHARYGREWYGIFVPSYNAAAAVLRSLLRTSPPATFAERQAILDLLAARRAAVDLIAQSDTMGREAFGRFWLGQQTDWRQIAAWETWDAQALESDPSLRFRELRAKISDTKPVQRLAGTLEQQLRAFLAGFNQLCKALKVDTVAAFEEFGPGSPSRESGSPRSTAAHMQLMDAGNPDEIEAQLALLGPARTATLDVVSSRLQAWHGNPEALQQWQQLRMLRNELAKAGAADLADRMDDGRIAPELGTTALKFAYFEAMFRVALKQSPDLNATGGSETQKLREQFCQLDTERIKLARFEVANSHFAGIGRAQGTGAAVAIHILRHEMQKKRRHLPLRQLINQAGAAIQAVKPVFMMSPLSVAQFLEPGALEFDLLVIDEASQVRPVEALGAAARCHQLVVVGDDQQMPPTQFFAAALGNSNGNDDEPAIHAGDIESILGLCISRNVPQRTLRWHYRSRHHSLIAVSNRQFYGNQLLVVPSPERAGELGIKYHRIEGGKFEDGTNEVEAKAVAAAVIEHARHCPQWTLGVAAFSLPQRDALIKEIELLRRAHPELESFFDPGASDPFFVKNLENVQGDERDVIFVSCGYGPAEDGKISLNFGPISAAGGERRLNVLITRAKRRCEVFATLRADDIDLNRATGRGPAVLRAFLEFAQSGGETGRATGQVSHDLFVETIRKQLAARRYEVHTNVGVAGIFVDLAVVDPDDQSHFILGIEVDGPSFRKAKTARDRERLRESVLRGQGWNLQYVRAVEWFHRPQEQLNRLVTAIQASREQHSRDEPGPAAEVSLATEVFVIDRHEANGDPLATTASEPGRAPYAH